MSMVLWVQVQGMVTLPFEALGRWKQLFVSVWHCLWECHPTGTQAIHPKSCWIEVQNIYYMTQTSCNWGNVNLIASITLSKVYFHDFLIGNYLCWCLFVTLKPRRTKGHPEHDFAIHHLPHLQLRWNFFEKIGNIFLHYLVALSSCNTRFEKEKWELSQLEYSGECSFWRRILTW